MKYKAHATKAANAGLPPATVKQTCDMWEALGVTRQTRWNWSKTPTSVPLEARLAAAWLRRQEGGE